MSDYVKPVRRNRKEQQKARERMAETGQTYQQALADVRREWEAQNSNVSRETKESNVSRETLEPMVTQEQIKQVMQRTAELEKAFTKAELVRSYRNLHPDTWTRHHPATWRKDELAKEIAMAQLGLCYPATNK